MSVWTERYRLAIPAALIPLGNKAAALFDPHGGGQYTFTKANAPEAAPTHCLVRTQLIDGYQHLLRSPRDPAMWCGMLGQMAAEKGLPALTLDEVTEMCNAFLFDDECTELEDQEWTTSKSSIKQRAASTLRPVR